MSRAGKRSIAIAGLVAASLLVGGCGDDAGESTAPSPAADPSAVEAAPEAPAQTTARTGEPGELPADQRAVVEAAVRSYIDALNAGDGKEVCALIVPGAVDLEELPAKRPGCARSLDASIGTRPRGGAPAWKRTTIVELGAVSVGADRARVTATVNTEFSDRKQPSIEEDVVYLERSGSGWLIAKPSGTFYRAVGYPEPPLRALTPP